MRYTVLWLPNAESDFAEIWMRAPNPGVVAEAADRLDRALSEDPYRVGESRTGKRRIAHGLPLGVDFSVGDEDMVVVVTGVWHCTKPHRG